MRQSLVDIVQVPQLLGRLVKALQPAGFSTAGQKLLRKLVQQSLALVTPRGLRERSGVSQRSGVS